MDKVEQLISKLEFSGLDKVKENLAHGRYSKWKLPHIEDWIKKKEAPTIMYHEVQAPQGNTFRASDVRSLEKKG